MALERLDTIRRYWTEHPTANIAMATGEISGIIVIDLDVRPSRHIDGVDRETAHGSLLRPLPGQT